MRFHKAPLAFPAAVALAFGLGLGACEDAFVTEVDVDLPASARELVVEATLRPADTSFVYVTRTRSIRELDGVDNVAGATLTLRVDGRAVGTFTETLRQNLSYRADPNASALISEYAAVLPAELFAPGREFELTVEAPGGERAVARQAVPAAGRLRGVTTVARDYESAVSFTIEDAPGRNAFVVDGVYKEYYPVIGPDGQPTGAVDSSAHEVSFSTGEDIDYVWYGRRFVTSDAGFDGSSAGFRLNANLLIRSPCYSVDGCGDVPRPRLRLTLRSVNALAGDYLRDLRQLSETDGNPFVEPIVLPSAFVGGRGMLILEAPASVVEVIVEP